MGTCAGAPWEGSAPLGARRRRLREDRFGVPLPSLSGGKEVPWRDTAHALPVGGFLAFRLAAPPTALLRSPQRSGRSHEFSVTVGAEKTLVIVTGHGFEESRASLGWEKWRFLSYFCNVQHGFRAARQSSRYVISAVWSGKILESSGHTKGPNPSPLSAACHPQSQQEVRAVIYMSQSGDGACVLESRRLVPAWMLFLGAPSTWSGRAKKGSTAVGNKVAQAEKRQPGCAAE